MNRPHLATLPLLLISGSLAVLPSCTNSSHLLLYQHSNLGMNTGINPASQAVHFRVGIRREFGAIVPKYAQAKIKEGESENASAKPVDDYEAASAYFGSRFRVTSIWNVPEAAEVLATGQAAVLAASNGRLRLRNDYDKVTSLNTPTADNKEPAPPAAPITDPGVTPADPEIAGIVR